ncbi:uncharacterized protein LOC121866304 isoform X2 [Homarus americanus]|nr:uncharacterized protein LOC121866304 isoform X2 [Homarus americanus]
MVAVMVVMVAAVVMVQAVSEAVERTEPRIYRRQVFQNCICVPNIDCYTENSSWSGCTTFGHLCCPPEFIGNVPLYVAEDASACICVDRGSCFTDLLRRGFPASSNSQRCSGPNDVCCPRDSVGTHSVITDSAPQALVTVTRVVTSSPSPQVTVTRVITSLPSPQVTVTHVITSSPSSVVTPENVVATLPGASVGPGSTGEPCSTTGTPEGICLRYTQCEDQLSQPVKLLTILQFLQNYGCGVDSNGDVRVCCPV